MSKTKLMDAKLIEMNIFEDSRGFFRESYSKQKFIENGIDIDFLQDNHSFSKEPGTLRGMHYQLQPKSQTKLIECVSGVIFDVIVDLRKGSPTYLEWEGFLLSEHNHYQLLIPKGFAHGFCTLTENVQIQYKVDEYYSSENDYGFKYNDEKIGICWPMKPKVISEKDLSQPNYDERINDFEWRVN